MRSLISFLVNNRKPLKQGSFLGNIKEKLCADKGHIAQVLFENLFLNEIQLATKIKQYNELTDEHCWQDSELKKSIN